MRNLTATICLTIAVLFGGMNISFAQWTNCVEDSLSTNNNGKFLMTLSGRLFETLAGDSIDAMLWLPVSILLFCGPNIFT